jgi:hypothetical protein
MEELSDILEAYYYEINIIPENNRKLDQVYARSAMMVAMRKYMTLMQVGRVFGKNHATIHHAVKNHEQNHQWSAMYRFFYDVAEKILVEKPSLEIQKDNTLAARFSRQKMRIQELEGENNNLKQKCLELEQKITTLEEYGNRV